MQEHVSAIREENIRLIFGLKIRQLRMDKGLSLADIAGEAGISISYLNEIEKGKKYPKANKIALLAQVLGVSYDWLVSLQLNRRLKPIAELIKSDLLTSLPLDIFGIEPNDLIDLITNTPTKVSAFISTLVEIARNYDMSVENFYFSVLRSYQEMHENYFEEIEEKAEAFMDLHGLQPNALLSYTDFKHILQDTYGYAVDEEGLDSYEELKGMRSVLLQKNGKYLLLNGQMSEAQKMFTLGRELGYVCMDIKKDRSYTFAWTKINSFEQVLNNFKASYFAGALLIPRKNIVEDLQILFDKDFWDETFFMNWMSKYHSSSEMLLHRLTGIVPRFFMMPHLFFLRFNHRTDTLQFDLNKELHLAGLYNPHGTMFNEHYCRKWISLNILKEYERLSQQGDCPEVLCGLQRSQYIDSDNEYICISLARALNPTPDTHSSVTIGFLMNKEFKKNVKFWNDDKIPVRQVGVACERCPALDCEERAAPPKALDEKKKSLRIQAVLEELEQIKNKARV